jgi:hypothetical protein
MRALDEQEQLVCDAEISCAVIGKGGDFVLIRLDENSEGDQALTEEAAKKGYAFCGVLGVKDGQAGAKCQPEPDAVYTMMCAALTFAQYVAAQLKPKDDSAAWCERLHILQDPRDVT